MRKLLQQWKEETKPIEEEQIETASNITVDSEVAIDENETRQMSYSEVVGQHQRERRREVAHIIDNG
ncbi:hypothetical protein F8M41_016427 [Gigaspora margarita]|uniref:Uncharacterized protein n=1 Tax=Gigaspora margarita TaxID=4874 RepID=A0A8H4APL0_GIGMA|nr:hypothetical protein F8M41_016427 [Gigaspora margarita]